MPIEIDTLPSAERPTRKPGIPQLVLIPRFEIVQRNGPRENDFRMRQGIQVLPQCLKEYGVKRSVLAIKETGQTRPTRGNKSAL